MSEFKHPQLRILYFNIKLRAGGDSLELNLLRDLSKVKYFEIIVEVQSNLFPIGSSEIDFYSSAIN